MQIVDEVVEKRRVQADAVAEGFLEADLEIVDLLFVKRLGTKIASDLQAERLQPGNLRVRQSLGQIENESRRL